jgi:hypothetical protein
MSPQSEQSPGDTTNKLVSISPAIKEKKKKGATNFRKSTCVICLYASFNSMLEVTE